MNIRRIFFNSAGAASPEPGRKVGLAKAIQILADPAESSANEAQEVYVDTKALGKVAFGCGVIEISGTSAKGAKTCAASPKVIGKRWGNRREKMRAKRRVRVAHV